MGEQAARWRGASVYSISRTGARRFGVAVNEERCWPGVMMNIHSSCTHKRETFAMGVKSIAIENKWGGKGKDQISR
jgi:hypothetical protein